MKKRRERRQRLAGWWKEREEKWRWEKWRCWWCLWCVCCWVTTAIWFWCGYYSNKGCDMHASVLFTFWLVLLFFASFPLTIFPKQLSLVRANAFNWLNGSFSSFRNPFLLAQYLFSVYACVCVCGWWWGTRVEHELIFLNWFPTMPFNRPHSLAGN